MNAQPNLVLVSDLIGWLQETLNNVGNIPVALTSDNAEMYPLSSVYLIALTKDDIPDYSENLCVISALSIPTDKEDFVENLCFMSPVIEEEEDDENV